MIPSASQIRKQALATQLELIETELQNAGSLGQSEFCIGDLFPEVVERLRAGGYRIKWRRRDRLYSVSWKYVIDEDDDQDPSTTTASEDEEDDRERFCIKCHTSLDMDANNIDGWLPAYMGGLCSVCYDAQRRSHIPSSYSY